MTELLSHDAARASGASRYFTGRACANGHVVERYTSSKGCVSCVKAASRRNRTDNPATVFVAWQRHLRKTYGLTPQVFDTMLQAQSGCCAICGDPFGSDPCVDHDHATGVVRGLLCHGCNKMLGHARDRIDTLKAAIDYLCVE